MTRLKIMSQKILNKYKVVFIVGEKTRKYIDKKFSSQENVRKTFKI